MGEEVPKKGKAAVVVNEGPEFRVEIQEVDVPEPSTLFSIAGPVLPALTICLQNPMKSSFV